MKITVDLSVTSAPQRARRGWYPDWLFRNGAKGIWLDAADTGCLFQDAAGAFPVTAPGQTVGLFLDKSQALARGPNIGTPADAELINAPDYASYDAEEDHYHISRDSGGGGEVRFPVPADSFIEVDIEVSSEGGGAAVALRDGSTVLTTVGPGHGRTRRIIKCPSGTLRINLPSFPLASRFRIFALGTLAGNHATQPITARRPLYQSIGNLHWLEFDGIDDCLRFDLGFSASDGFQIAYAGSVAGNGRLVNRAASNADLWGVASGRWVGMLTADSLDAAGFGFDLNAPHVGAYRAFDGEAALAWNGADGPVAATDGKPLMFDDMAFGARSDGVAAYEGTLSALVIRQGGLSGWEDTRLMHHLKRQAGVEP